MWRNVFQVSVSNDFSSYIPAEEEDVEAFNAGIGNGPGKDMRLDFARGYSGSRWNKQILQQIYDLIVSSRQNHGGWGLPDVSEGYLMGELQGQLKRSQESWAQVQPRFIPGRNEVETLEQVADRVESYQKKRMGCANARSLRKRVSKQLATNIIALTY